MVSRASIFCRIFSNISFNTDSQLYPAASRDGWNRNLIVLNALCADWGSEYPASLPASLIVKPLLIPSTSFFCLRVVRMTFLRGIMAGLYYQMSWPNKVVILRSFSNAWSWWMRGRLERISRQRMRSGCARSQSPCLMCRSWHGLQIAMA